VGSIMSNIAIGSDTLSSASSNLSNNVILGWLTAKNLANANGNVIAGSQAGIYAGITANFLTDAVNCVFIGNNATGNNTQVSNQIVIGHQAVGVGDNTIRLGNSAITRIEGQVSWSTASDSRIKENIELANIRTCYIDVMSLPVKRFSYKPETGVHLDRTTTGFIADDVEKVFPKVVQYDDRHYPIIDKKGKHKKKKIVYAEQEIDYIDKETGEPVYKDIEKIKEVDDTYVIKGHRTLTWNNLDVATLWAAVQYLGQQVEGLQAQLVNK